MFRSVLVVVALFLALPSSGQRVFENERELGRGNFTLRWNPDFERSLIDFEIEAQTTGWVALTFYRDAENGGWADTIFAGVYNNNLTSFYNQDRYCDQEPIDDETRCFLDATENWTLTYGSERRGVTLVGLERKFDTDDHPFDTPSFQDELLKIRWAYGSIDLPRKVDPVIPYSGVASGVTEVNLLYPKGK